MIFLAIRAPKGIDFDKRINTIIELGFNIYSNQAIEGILLKRRTFGIDKLISNTKLT